jgi:hypothetical protein
MRDDDEPADLDNRVHTKIFDYDDDDVPFENHPQTRLLDDDDEPDEVDRVHTKILDDGESCSRRP